MSDTVTRAPRRTSSSAAAMPLRAAPATVTRFPSTENAGRLSTNSPLVSSQLQRCQTEEPENDRRDHESRDHFRFAPANQLEVMVKWRHAKHTLAGQLERRHLNDHRQRFDDEDAADDHQQQL